MLVARICKKFKQNNAVLVVVFKAKSVYIKHFESHSTQQIFNFQHYYLSYCDYLLKMGRMDEKQAVFEQLTSTATSRSGVPQH